MPGGWEGVGGGGGDLKGTSSSLLCCCAIPLAFYFIFPTATCLERSGVDLISQVISRERAGEGRRGRGGWGSNYFLKPDD